ncbi:malonyl-ACP O-methyltransferase BioC [Marinilabiliaceae bacterium ANBcel2]|nr:malonyl-ACP O-methyltransferase BioC [Marinilabiliaceae bacterium ANBcel2]
MKNLIDKSIVKRRFNKSLTEYHQQAAVQKDIALFLASKISSLYMPPSSRLMEIGCGSGFLTEKIVKHISFQKMWCNDITSYSRQVIECLAKRYSVPLVFFEGDAETIDFPSQLDAVISSSTIQWFNHQKSFFQKVCKSLNSGGVFAFSSFGEDNFYEISSITNIGLSYYTLNELTYMLSKQFDIIYSKEWYEVITFKNPLEVLHHLKKTGVNGVRRAQFGKSSIKEFTGDYARKFSADLNHVTLTYHPLVVIAVKK